MTQKLEIYQSLWGMELRSPHVAERTAEESFAMIAAAGFDGVCLDPSVAEIPEMRTLEPLYKEYGLGCMVNAFPYHPDDMRPLLEFAKDFDACMVNVISGVMPIRPEDAVPTVRRWMREAEEIGMPLLFETHRELRAPVPERDQAHIESILDRSDCFQGRIATREQVQVPIDFPQHQQWVEIFQGWWRYGMRQWRRRNADDARLVFLCELGPPPYAITDGDQRELSDRWQESLKISEWAQEIWRDFDEQEVDLATS